MEPVRLLLLFSTIAFLGAVVQALVALKAGRWSESRWHLLPMALGFILQTGSLYLRSQQIGRCPLTNVFEAFVFIGWSIVLLYFLVGTAYRLSLLGLFTAPLVASIQLVSLSLTPDQAHAAVLGKVNAWLEFHAAIALIAYAAFALACVSGIMFLLQERALKRHRINALFHQLPPIHDLSRAIARMVFLGVGMLSVAMFVALKIQVPVTNGKLLVSWFVLSLYVLIALLMWCRTFSARQTAWLAVLGFLVPLFSMWIVAK